MKVCLTLRFKESMLLAFAACSELNQMRKKKFNFLFVTNEKCEVYKSAIPYLLLLYGLNLICTVQVCLIFWRSNA